MATTATASSSNRPHRRWHWRVAALGGGLAFVLSTTITTATASQTTRPTNENAVELGTALFSDLVTANAKVASTLFFPESAYVEMKTGQLPNPAADYTNRLLAFYSLDEAAYHRYLTAGGQPRLLRVLSDPSQAQWIAPGVCENNVGYWHQPPIRLVYRQRGVVKSVAIDSLISWRGRFFVVHLGPNPRPVNVGTVDQPERGAGLPGPAGGC